MQVGANLVVSARNACVGDQRTPTEPPPPARASGATPALVTVALTCLAWTLLFNSGFVPQLTGLPPVRIALGEATSVDELVEAGAAVYEAECSQCHLVGMAGRGPDLAGVGALAVERAGARGSEGGGAGYLLDALCRPADWLVPGFANIMPPQQRRLEGGQLLATVAFLQSLGSEPTVDGSEVALIEAHCGADAGAVSTEPVGGPTDVIVTFGCLACHDMAGDLRGLGPGLGGVGARLSPEQIRESLLDPDATVTQVEPPWVPGLMRATLEGNGFYVRMTEQDLDALVEYLVGLRAEPTVPDATPEPGEGL